MGTKLPKCGETHVLIPLFMGVCEEVIYGSADVCYHLIKLMKQVGINVVAKTEVGERFAVIDDELVWHGGMNLLGKVDIWDNLMRIKNHQVAAELLEISLGTTREFEGG